MEGRFRSRYGRMAVTRAALIVFLIFAALIAGIVFTLDLSARHSNRHEATTELGSTARVAASTFSTMQANLRTRVSELAASSSLQQAVRSCTRRPHRAPRSHVRKASPGAAGRRDGNSCTAESRRRTGDHGRPNGSIAARCIAERDTDAEARRVTTRPARSCDRGRPGRHTRRRPGSPNPARNGAVLLNGHEARGRKCLTRRS
jgi:hypothetical protein